jgi:hypothetical protein
VPVRDGEQGSIGFQPVPRDRCAWPGETGDDVGVSQGCRSIGAGYRLEAYATLKLERDGLSKLSNRQASEEVRSYRMRPVVGTHARAIRRCANNWHMPFHA